MCLSVFDFNSYFIQLPGLLNFNFIFNCFIQFGFFLISFFQQPQANLKGLYFYRHFFSIFFFTPTLSFAIRILCIPSFNTDCSFTFNTFLSSAVLPSWFDLYVWLTYTSLHTELLFILSGTQDRHCARTSLAGTQICSNESRTFTSM